MIVPWTPLVDGINALVRGIYSKKFDRERKKYKRASKDDFTILLPVYKDGDRLEDTLDHLERYKGRVLVVDDGSNDNNTGERAKKKGFKVIANLRNSKKIGAIARGLEEIDTKYTVLMDSDTYFEGDLEDIVGMVEQEDLDACAGRVLPKEEGGILNRLQFLEYAKAMSIGRGSMDGGNPMVPCVSGAFGVFKTDMLKEVTDEQIKDGIHWEGEDFERTLRIIEKGGRVSYLDDFEVRTDAPKTFWDFTRQRIKWQHGYLRCHWDFKKFLMSKNKLGATFWYNWGINLLVHPLKLASLPALAAASIDHPEYLPIFYGAYVTIEAVSLKSCLSGEEWKRNIKYIPLMPFYNLYHVIVPTTLGYLSAIKEKITEALHRNKDPPIDKIVNQIPEKPGRESYSYIFEGLSEENTQRFMLEEGAVYSLRNGNHEQLSEILDLEDLDINKDRVEFRSKLDGEELGLYSNGTYNRNRAVREDLLYHFADQSVKDPEKWFSISDLTEPVFGEELSYEARNYKVLYRNLEELVERGVLVKTKKNRRNYYQLNPEYRLPVNLMPYLANNEISIENRVGV